MKQTVEKIQNWLEGLVTTQEMLETAKANGYKLERECDTIHATGRNSFSIRIK